MVELRFLGRLLAELDARTRGRALYMQDLAPWTEQSLGAVLERDIYSDELPPLAVSHRLYRVLSASDVMQVVQNARSQKSTVSETELVAALNFYFANDAFIDFSRG
jgi:hypothetical protein